MNKWMKKICALSLTTALAGTLLAGCGNSNDNAGTGSSAQTDAAGSNVTVNNEEVSDPIGEATMLKIMFRSDKPTGWDDIEAAVEEKMLADGLNIQLDVNWVAPAEYKDKLNLSITGGEKWDLVFDATFIQLRNLAADGYYADLSEYWNNDEYPGLKECFPEKLIENNMFYGQKCVIPLLRTYGTGIPAVFYRQDWADEWGIGKIDSFEKLQEYWEAVKENEAGVYPLGVTGSRGFYQLLGYDSQTLAKHNIQMLKAGSMTNYVYIEDNQVAAIAAEGAGDEAFKDFPEGYNRDFGLDRYEVFAGWRNTGYTETDALAQTDVGTQFYSGLCGSMIGTLDDVEGILTQMASYSPEAALGYFVYIDSVRNMEEGAIGTGYQANNFVCIPKNSDNIEQTMKFLDWLFSSEENHDLIELGIEGQDWKDNGDGTYGVLSQYVFPGYALTWTSQYVKFGDNIPADVLEYRQYELKDSTFVPVVLPGFVFDASSLATETAQVKAIADKIAIVSLHGITNDGTTVYGTMAEMFKANVDEVMVNGGQTIQEELVKQINEYLSNRK